MRQAPLDVRPACGLALVIAFCSLAEARDEPALYGETYRPRFHFSPRSGWIGDPDGLIRHWGKYHL
jgi:fructan beta-fructosidase